MVAQFFFSLSGGARVSIFYPPICFRCQTAIVRVFGAKLRKESCVSYLNKLNLSKSIFLQKGNISIKYVNVNTKLLSAD